MHKKIVSIICSASTFIFLTAYLGVTPACSAPVDKKTEIQKPADKSKKELGDLKDGSKGKEPVKKKVVKKAGTAAVVGVAGGMVTSGVKGKVTKDKE